jgi:flagellar motor switch protein FliM
VPLARTRDERYAPANSPSADQARTFAPRQPGRLAQPHHAALTIVTETFARRVSLRLSARLRTSVDVDPGRVRQAQFGALRTGFPNPACLTVASQHPFAQPAVLQFDLPLAFALVERICGGPARRDQPSRRLSEVEISLLGEVTDVILGELDAAFAPVVSFTSAVTRWEDEPQLLKVVPPGCPMIVVSPVFRFDETEGALDICIPFATLEAALDDFADATPTDGAADPDSSSAVASTLLATTVDVSVRFQPLTLTPGEILGLSVGDVVALRHPAHDPLTLSVSDIPLLAGVPGRRGRRLACRIVEMDQENTR